MPITDTTANATITIKAASMLGSLLLCVYYSRVGCECQQLFAQYVGSLGVNRWAACVRCCTHGCEHYCYYNTDNFHLLLLAMLLL
jgi:hypothetical protein